MIASGLTLSEAIKLIDLAKLSFKNHILFDLFYKIFVNLIWMMLLKVKLWQLIMEIYLSSPNFHIYYTHTHAYIGL